MEEETQEKINKKRLNLDDENNSTRPTKKVRLGFSGKKFREQIKTEQKIKALQHFLQLINEETKQECISTYLEQGGNCTEILQIMENDSTVSPILIFEIVNHILLQINARFPQYQNAAHESCRYLLNNYITLINKMLGLSSSSKERLVMLKLLTTIVTFSVVLAKDILLHVNFNPSNLELLTKVSEQNEVRSSFIHFIVAFLVDGHFPTLSVLLEKKGLMTSIVNGLHYDRADVVVLVLSAMKDHILENPSVSKTAKMKTFNTPVVKDIVNLYNWKGPGGIVDQKKKNKIVTIDEIDKSEVNEAVHAFLMILCTSHKYGVIFKDHNVGLGKRHQNSLMYTILDSLERPWEHSYAGELVVKICRACPDLTKTMWMNMKPFLEPRWTVKWLNTMKFTDQLLNELQPDCIEFCVNSLNIQQLVQVISTLIAPVSILKAIIPEDGTYSKIAIKYHVLLLLLKMVKSAQNYLKQSENWKNIDHEVLKTALSTHFTRNFPEIRFILTDWDQSDEDLSTSAYLKAALDFMEEIQIMAPKMLGEIESVLNIKDFLLKIEDVAEKPQSRKLQIQAVKLFINLEPTVFRPKADLFETVVLFSLEFYHKSKDTTTLSVLHSVLRNSGIFDDFLVEIDLWIDGVLNLKNYDRNVGVFLCNLIEKANDHASVYDKKLLEFNKAKFSPLILILSDSCGEIEAHKALKNYLNFVILNIFHLQTDPAEFISLIAELRFLSDDLLKYMNCWTYSEGFALSKCKGVVLEHFRNFSVDFLENHLENSACSVYPNFKLNLLQAMMFYLTNLIKAEALRENHIENCRTFFNFLVSENVFENDCYVRTILGNPVILHNLTLFDSNNFITKFVIDVVKGLKHCPIEEYLIIFRQKIVSIISKIFKKPSKYEKSTLSIELVETFDLDYGQCYKLIERFVSVKENKRFYRVACYCLDRMASLARNDLDLEPLTNDVINSLSHILAVLISDQILNLHHFSLALLNYLKIFPHNIQGVEIELFNNLLTMSEFSKDNILLCEFLMDRKPEFMASFKNNLDQICTKKGFLLSLLHIAIKKDDAILEEIFEKFKDQIIKALQKPHKAGQHFQNHYESVGILVRRFLKPDKFGGQIQKFESTELFHVYLLNIIYDKIEKNDKNLGNMIMTFVHLLNNLLKQKSGSKSPENFDKISQVLADFLHKIEKDKFDLVGLSSNETFKMFCKLCLKYGISGDVILTKILAEFVEFCVGDEDAKLILEMLFSHSQFLDVVLGDSHKTELLDLWRVICRKWPQFMERSHVPVLLSAYKATRGEADRTVLDLLKMYESRPDQTQFYDFKPFLWGRAAASHYSVRSDLQKVLWRQPKMGDVLDNLHLPTIQTTIIDPSSPDSYDLNFFLPLFSHLLAPENPVQTYRFTRSGALALTLTALRGDKPQRLAACYVLSRFYFHLEARQTGKDNLLWMRFVEAICKGTAVLDELNVNNFVGVFLARTALVLTQPSDVMYVPLTQYLTAKDSLDFGTIPELYTFLHSSHVDSKEHKMFILEVLRDGLRGEKDLTTLLRSMGFKLISELCSSTISDFQTKILILDIFKKCCRIPLGVKILCGSLSFLTQIFSLFVTNLEEKQQEVGVVQLNLLQIMLQIVEMDDDRHRNFIIYMTLIAAIEDDRYFRDLIECKGLEIYYHVLLIIANRFPQFFTEENMDSLLEKSKDKFCKYLRQNGRHFVRETDFSSDPSANYYLRLLYYNKLK